MSDLFIPFNHQPASTDVKTGSYTVASGFYGRVKPLSHDVTVNSENIVNKNINFDSSAGGDVTFTPTGPCVVSVFYYQSSAGTCSLKINSFVFDTNTSTTVMKAHHGVRLGSGATITATRDAGTGRLIVTGYYINEDAPVWVKSTDQLAGTSYYIELYNELT